MALLADALTWARYRSREITKPGRPRGQRKGPHYRPRPTLAQVLWEPGTTPPDSPVPDLGKTQR